MISPSSRTPSGSFPRPITKPSRSRAALIAQRIEKDILAAERQVGSVIGSERDLLDRYGVSRAVLREAVRLVEHHGLAVARPGPNGGLVTTEPQVLPTVLAFVVYLEHVGTTLDDLFSARLALEPLAASLTAESLTESGIAVLRKALADEIAAHQSDQRSAIGDRLHLAIAKLTGNAALHLFIESLTWLTTRFAEHFSAPPPSVRASADLVEHDHKAIVDAIIAGNNGLAGLRTTEHLASIASAIRARQLEGTQYNAARSSRPEGKRAEVLAYLIREDIIRRGWIVGEVLGSEADLIEQYNVSRAVLREAARLLAHHGVAEMRRGPNGGLVVTEPDPTASIETMALYLAYWGISAEDLGIARDSVELACLDLLVNRINDGIVPAETLKMLRHQQVVLSSGRWHEAFDLHVELPQLCGNPVLALFAAVLSEIGPTSHVAEAGPRHGAILEAILHGDSALARYRMTHDLASIRNDYSTHR